MMHEFLTDNMAFQDPRPPRKVYTYFTQDPRLPDFSAELALWEETWRARGWETEILGPDDAKQHPEYYALRKRAPLPSVNPAVYEQACFDRWMALSAVGGQLMVDFDVMNLEFRPGVLDYAYPLLFLHSSVVPCAVFSKNPEVIVKMIQQYRPEDAIQIDGRQHCSDQEMFRLPRNANQIAHQPECAEFGSFNWSNSPLVHFSNASLAAWGKKKADIRSILDERLGV